MTDIDERYQRGQIYCIRSPQTEMIYYGSSIQPLYKRFYGHNKDMRTGVYCSSQEILKLGDAYIEWVENFPCNSKKELDRREGQIQRENKDICVNSSIAGRTQKEWREDNKQGVAEYQKKYKEDNKQGVAEYQKKYQKKYQKEHQKKLKDKRKERIRAKKTSTASPQQLASSFLSILPN